jgi:serine/threonine-protein kinase
MMSLAVHPSDRDQRLAVLLEETARRQRDGQAVDWTALRQEHPDLVDELRQLVAMGQVVEGLAASQATADPAPPQLAGPPRTLPCRFGAFELQEELGRGGMGVVYKAWDKELERHVALKMILRGPSATASDLARFRSEAGSAAALNHPGIVPIFQISEHDGQPFFVMKLVEGQTLTALVKHGPLPPRRAAALLRVIAEAVQHAHERGVVHRDLKPSNILVDAADQPLVTDFGLAKRVADGASLTRTGAILGTPSYMAPEQAEGSGNGNPGPAADVYSMGAMLYEMLTGRPPFLAATPLETLLLVRSEEPVRPMLLNPQLDLDLELICRKCLEKRPEHRYATAGDLARDLQAYLDGEPVSAQSNSLWYFATKLLRETHHAPVMENWGMLWMVHSAKILLLCIVTGGLHAAGVDTHLPYLALWGIGLVAWALIFWQLRRRAGPVTFVERQVAHAWGAGVAASIGMFVIEVFLRLSPLTLTPALGVVAGMVFVFIAGTL